MKNIYTTTFAASILLLASCKESPKADNVMETAPLDIKNAEWLTGSWGNTTKDGELVENWHKVNDSVFHGESFFIVGKDTVFAESVILDDIAGNMAYTVTVPDQNDAKPVRFSMTSIAGKELIFENPKHDFPNKIVYSNPIPDSLVAVIYGIKDGKPASETFKMKRKK